MKNEAEEIFTIYLKNGKNRITPERFEVLKAALSYRGHFGADELYVFMKNNHTDVSRATVYNTLDLLAGCNLLIKRNFGDNRNVYENNTENKNHEHLVCTNCGKIVEFNSPELKLIVDSVSQQLGFSVANYTFNIYGKCKDGKDCFPKNE